MVIRRLPAELADVVRRTAHYPHGLGFLHQAWVDSVAVTLGVHPFAIDAMARPPSPTPSRRTRHDCEERARALIETARGDPRGLGFLTDGPPEEVADAFHVHPYLVFRARGILERRATFEEPDPVAVRE
jgi:hypothetical protein